MLRAGERQKLFVRRLLGVKPQRLTRAALETLALVAYRQPVTRPEIEDVRGVDCGAVLKALLERRMLKIIGKKEEPGRPLLYGTTKEFLEVFGLKSLTSPRTLRGIPGTFRGELYHRRERDRGAGPQWHRRDC